MSAEGDQPSAKKTGIVAWVVRIVTWIVIAFFVLCVVAAIIIPNLPVRGSRSKTSEANSNLGAIRSEEVAYFAEWNSYIGGQSLTPVADRRHRPKKEKWNPNTRFSILGFVPEGDVYYSYSLEGPAFSAAGFTACAVGDLDDDGQVSVYSVNNSSTEIMRSGAPF